MMRRELKMKKRGLFSLRHKLPQRAERALAEEFVDSVCQQYVKSERRN